MSNFWLSTKKPILALAPMAGYTNSAFRLICRQMGADIVYSEMISADALCYKNKKTLAMLQFKNKEKPLIFQLFGNNPQRFIQAVKFLNHKFEKQKNIGIDINFGCPAHKVCKTGSGAALMNETRKAKQIIEEVCANTSLPVSLKIRSKVKKTTALEFANSIKDLPFQAIMLHGRSLNQGFTGEIDLKTIKQVKQTLKDKIVLANGGIDSPEKAKKILAQTNCHGLGLARSALGRPWLFQEIKKNKKIEKNKKQIKKIIIKHAKYFLENNKNLIPLRSHLIYYIKGQKNARTLRQRLIHIEKLKQLKKLL